jgi:FkbM family methyltransferase
VANRLSNLTIAAGLASSNSAMFERSDYGYLTSRLSNIYFFKFASTLDVDLLIECGANAAETAISFARNLKVRAVAIEANPLVFKERTSKSSTFGVLPICLALGDAKGRAKLMVPTDGNRDFDGASSLSQRNDDSLYREFVIEQSTLDLVVEEKGLVDSRRIALWVDVEGRALEVLKGAQELLDAKRVSLIYVEVETRQFWQNQHLAPDVDEFLAKNGFTAVIRDLQSKDQFNLIYARDELLSQCDELVFEYWRELSTVGRGLMASFRFKASALKRNLIKDNTSSIAPIVHFVAFLLGSKSSRLEISKRLNVSSRSKQ